MRRGSALLIVLGMLAFMLFSGLAFSVYVRQSRLPTSFLRRTVATRQLAKAGLAEAIDHIDQAIGDDPHPGVHRGSYQSGAISNIWSRRVFIGIGTSSGNSNDQEDGKDIQPLLLDPANTVPTLTLEALAYLPPNLINEARYFSRRTPTARWHSFWFDSGRYAYTAIDVSDYFDVHRMFANEHRSSSASKRISFTHLFEEGSEHEAPTENDLKDWDDKFMKGFRVADEKGRMTGNTPFFSLADFNLAFASKAKDGEFCGLKCPLYAFLKGEKPYDVTDTEDPNCEAYRNMTFVTDGWYPVARRTDDSGNAITTYNLDDKRNQPFSQQKLEKDGFVPGLDDLTPASLGWMRSNGWRLNELNRAALWDYLDLDSVPISLCIPTVERVPMICGVRPRIVGDTRLPITSRKVVDDTISESKKEIDGVKWDICTRKVEYSLDVTALVGAIQGAEALLTYPFKEHGFESDMLNRSFTIDGRIAVFLSEDKSVSIRPSKFAVTMKSGDASKGEVLEKAVLTFPIKKEKFKLQNMLGKITREAFPCWKQELVADDANLSADDLRIATVEYKWPKVKYVEDASGNEVPVTEYNDPVLIGDTTDFGYSHTEIVKAESVVLHPLLETGARAEDSTLLDILKQRQSVKLTANAAIWLRVLDDENHVVDQVPACHRDEEDNDLTCREMCGGGDTGYPLLRVVAKEVDSNGSEGDAMYYSIKNLAGGSFGTVNFPDTKWIISDPRYNHAVENWVVSGGADVQEGDLTADDWAKDGGPVAQQVKSGDGDIFMATSDAGYLQSIYEFAHLPRVAEGFNVTSGNGGSSGDDIFGYYNTKFSNSEQDYPKTFSAAKNFNGTGGKQMMWRTYCPYGDSEEFRELEEVVVSGGGMKVNPYSDSVKVLMAAFANTPHDWRAAATNDTDLADLTTMTAMEFNKKHAWNEYSSTEGGKMCWDCLENVAQTLKSKVREDDYIGDWEDAFAHLGWSSDQNKILSEEIDSDDGDKGRIYAVDKKFLYGFWHDCFEVRQQLFLIFVRAEPMMMGGGVAGQTPPQLGSRAVALVWRDPTPSTGTRTMKNGTTIARPHRTRVLFYHPFD